MNRWALSLSLAAAVACRAPSEKEPSSVRVTLSLPPLSLSQEVELRPVHLWTHSDGTRKVAATGEPRWWREDGTEASWELSIPIPSGNSGGKLKDDEVFTFSTYGGYQNYYWPLAVGLTLLFEDRDGDDAFSLSDPQCADCDRIYGMTTDATSTLGFIPDIDSHLQELFPEEASVYYGLGGTSHGLVQLQSGGFGYPSVPTPITLQAQEPAEGALRYLCDYTDGQFTSLNYNAHLSTALFLDKNVDSGLCGTTVTTCEHRDLAAERPPPLELQPGEVRHVAQCRLREDVEALIVHTETFDCVGCACVTTRHDEVRLAAPAKLPSWWPCGHEVPICTAGDTFISYAESCEETASEGTGGSPGTSSGATGGAAASP